MEQNGNECDGQHKSEEVDNNLHGEICFEDTLELIMRNNNKDKDPFDSRRVYKKQKVY